jgi:ABC-type transport system substrate-binding protein
MFLNTKAGLMPDVRIRRALLAAIGDPLLWRAAGSPYPQGTNFYDPETPGYDAHDPAKAAAMLKAAG